jgi:hypothetical protein
MVDELKKLKDEGLIIMSDKSVRTLPRGKKIHFLKISPKGRLSVPKIVMAVVEELHRYTCFVPLRRNDHSGNAIELVLYLMDDEEATRRERDEGLRGIKRIGRYEPDAKDPTTSYFELGTQLKELGLLSHNSNTNEESPQQKSVGFMIGFKSEKKKIILELDRKR